MVMNERTLNGHIADAMQEQAPPNFEFWAEQQGTARQGNTVPDIRVNMPYGLRGIVELEYGQPAVADATDKLGYQFRDADTLPMRSILAVGIPESLGKMGLWERRAFLASDEPHFLLQVVTGAGPQDPNRTIVPDKPVAVSLRDLVHYAWLAAIPEDYSQRELTKVINALHGARDSLLRRFDRTSPAEQEKLQQTYNPDGATGLAGVAGNVVGTLASMAQLHLTLKEWSPGELMTVLPLGDPSLWQQIGNGNGIPSAIAREWRKIEDKDYQPLTTLAAAMLEDPALAAQVGATLRVVHATMNGISAGISATTNVAAEIWQSLIPDRNERAAYYTKPITAVMLANLTVPRLSNPAAARYNEICAGTGTIARATEECIRFRHYAATDDKASIHARRMENYIRLTDINQQSVSVATANMAALEPDTPYRTNAIFAITAAGGALNYLTERGVSDMQDALIGRDGKRSDMLVLERHTADLCNNNDPYFRAGGDGVRNPVSETLMREYKRRADRRVPGVANGMAGFVTFMQVIEHELLNYGGVQGKVLPLAAARADSYTGFRRHLERDYRDLIAISGIPGSADTSIEEMLVVGAKAGPDEGGDRAVTCINLTRNFTAKIEAKMFADAIRREMAKGRQSGEIDVGGKAGSYYKIFAAGDGKPWLAIARGSEGNFPVLTTNLTQGTAWDPGSNEVVSFTLPMTTLDKVVVPGPSDALIGRFSDSKSPRGAFVIYAEDKAESKRNPCLWQTLSDEQVKMTCQPTHYGKPRLGPDKVQEMLNLASRFHISLSLRMSSQKIAAAYTEQACMGGTAWATIQAAEGGEDGIAEAVILFLNSTFGLLIRSGIGLTTNQGRARIYVKALASHPIPDFAGDTPAAAAARQLALDNFDRLRQLELERIALAAIDPNRAEIDRVVTLMLGLPYDVSAENMLAEWRKMLSLEPSVNGGNKGVLAALAEQGIRQAPGR